MPQQTIQLKAGNKTGNAYLAAPPFGGPAVLVLHAWWGLTPVFKRVCDRLAEAGFVALAPDFYAGRTASTIEEAEALRQQPDSPYMESLAVEAVRVLRMHPLNTHHGKIGVIGFSMGASWILWLANEDTSDDIAAGVLFYGVGESENIKHSDVAFQGHFAVGDEWEPDEWVKKTEDNLRQAGLSVDFRWYDGVGHWFFEDDRLDAYNAPAAQLAWERTLAFLREHVS